MRRFKFSSSSLSRYLIAPANGAAQVVVWDTECRGLGAYRGKTGPGTYFVHFRVNGRQRKFTLGRINELAIPDARGRTVEIMAAAHQGRDVVEEREAADRARLTLADAFGEYTKALRRKEASPKTLLLNEHNWRKMLSPHGPRELHTLTRREVRAWHEGWGRMGPTAANHGARLLRAVYIKDQGKTEVECLVSTDDEAFTYNRSINRVSPVMERAMIVLALERGVPEAKLAAAMFLDVVSVKRRVKMLDGICDEATVQLADKQCPLAVFDILRKMMPLRQMAAAEFMVHSNNYSVAYASAILGGSSPTDLVGGTKAKPKGVTPAAMARMERELANLQAAVGSVQETFSRDNLHLMVAKGYLAKLLANRRVTDFMFDRYPEFLEQLQTIAEVRSALTSDATA